MRRNHPLFSFEYINSLEAGQRKTLYPCLKNIIYLSINMRRRHPKNHYHVQILNPWKYTHKILTCVYTQIALVIEIDYIVYPCSKATNQQRIYIVMLSSLGRSIRDPGTLFRCQIRIYMHDCVDR